MADEDVQSPFTSPIFTIFAGPLKKPFLAHAGIPPKSPVPRSIVDGEWKESNERLISLLEHNEATVERVLRWLYSGSYSVVTSPEISQFPNFFPKKRKAPHSPSDSDKDEVSISYEVNPRPHRRPLTPIGKIVYPGSYARSSSTAREAPQAYDDSTDPDTADILLPHAKIYALAQYLQLNDLKVYAFYMIKKFLKLYRLMIMTLRPIWRRRWSSLDMCTRTPGSDTSSHDPLRSLVSTFMALWFERYEGSAFGELMSEGGELVVDVVGKVQRIWTACLE